jgi:hypothetical protein
LIDKFPREMPATRFDALVASVNWYSKIPWIGPGLEAEHIRALLGDLPDLMERFRERVAADRAANARIVRRIDAGYLDEFARVA